MENSRSGMIAHEMGHVARQLTQEEVEKLQKDAVTVSDFKRNKLEKEAKKNWDLFYKRNTTKFFKDRHWTKREFEELCGRPMNGETLVIFEVGCGVGNFIFPLLEEDVERNLYFYACDFSPRAVQFVKDNALYDVGRCHAFQCDVTQDEISRDVPIASVDIATLIFVLSAINPEKMTDALKNLHKVMKPGGMVLFRDYGLYDHAMLRFATGHKLSAQFYVRQDGTRAYYFTVEKVKELFTESGFETVSCDYVNRQTVNRKEGLSVQRVFVQAKLRKMNNNQESNSRESSIGATVKSIELPVDTQLDFKIDGLHIQSKYSGADSELKHGDLVGTESKTESVESKSYDHSETECINISSTCSSSNIESVSKNNEIGPKNITVVDINNPGLESSVTASENVRELS